ncbi:MAG: hypothetical protein HOV80_17725 [Polyangiaceae bacterium]|nr:hypothetical protein [Polyangiaceae bacterium]
MLALSMWQPWAWAVVHLDEGGKEIENRQRRDGRMPLIVRHRGPLLIHASKKQDVAYYEDVAERIAIIIGRRPPPLEELQFGGIIGRAIGVATIQPDGTLWRGPSADRADEFFANVFRANEFADTRWHIPPQWGLVLRERRPLPFIPYKGMQGLFHVPDEVIP